MRNENLAPDNINNIDDLFEYLYGVRPKKKGTSAELLYYVIKKILNVSQDVKYYWNEKISLYNNNNIQMDVVEKMCNRYSKIIDVKDKKYNIDRQELQKIESTTQHIEKEYNLNKLAPVLVSTKGFSKGAKEWAKISNTTSKIELSIMRLSEDIDITDTILKFNVCINIESYPRLHELIFSKNDLIHNSYESGIENGKFQIILSRKKYTTYKS
ncbi:hypothetical protein OFR34_14505 [Brachyspira hyodysenteriae]|nr:hypothetical protein [Brachyspira hyodysenteriae]MDA0002134.1 hypothetical protein [Brachyspira hyodysenteriae]